MEKFTIINLSFIFPEQRHKYEQVKDLINEFNFESDEDVVFKLIEGKSFVFKKTVSILVPLRYLD